MVFQQGCESWTIKRLSTEELMLLNCDAGKDSWESLGQYREILDGHQFEQTPGDGEGQGSLSCCSPWGHKELDMTEWLNNNNKNNFIVLDVFVYGATRVARDLVNFDGSRVLRYLIQSILDNLLLSFIMTRSLKTRKHMVKVQKISCPQITLVQLR